MKGTIRLKRIDISRKTIEICSISAEDIKVYIVSKTDNMHVLQIKNLKVKLYKVNPRPEKKLVILEIYSHFKELFKKKQVDSVLPEYQDQDYEIKSKSGS